jgi:hypothetical protein
MVLVQLVVELVRCVLYCWPQGFDSLEILLRLLACGARFLQTLSGARLRRDVLPTLEGPHH